MGKRVTMLRIAIALLLATGAGSNFDGISTGDYVEVTGSTRHSAPVSPGHAPTSRIPAEPHPAVTRLPDCPNNTPSTGTVETCPRAMSCPDPSTVRMRRWTAPPGTERGQRGWVSGVSQCRGQGAVAPPNIELSTDDFRRLPLPAGVAVVQPPGDRVLVRMPTNVYATSTAPVELTTTVLGQLVRVRATPVAWTFDFGDGTVIGPTSRPGGPYPDLANAHAYPSRGTFTIRLVTSYKGEYAVAGGAWQPVTGTAEIASDVETVTVLGSHARLRADP